MIKFPSIEQFRNVIRNVQYKSWMTGYYEDGNPILDQTLPLPTLRFLGTVKLHGTNAGIVYDVETDTFQYQSRERLLTLDDDNAGFMQTMVAKENVLRRVFASYMHDVSKIVLYGEWCGGNIQRGVAINGLPKMFVVFAVKTQKTPDGDFIWHDFMQDEIEDTAEHGIYSILNFPTYSIDIDFNDPESAQNCLIKITEDVENECPVGKHFGVSGVGEGLVWSCVDEGYESSKFWFKTKGEKHASTKIRKLVAIDIEAIKNAKEFVATTVTETRLEQGLDNLLREQRLPFEMSSLGNFIRWIHEDIEKEELDTITTNHLDLKQVKSVASNVARIWFIKKLNENAVITN